MALKNFYANSKERGITLGFFEPQPGEPKTAKLACPFFSFYDPIKQLVEKDYDISLLVRFCPITKVEDLQKALDDKVKIRYTTDKRFHAKFYIIGDRVLVGSANLTQSGITTNYEASVVFKHGKDDRFEKLCDFFDELYQSEGVRTLNQETLNTLKKIREEVKRQQGGRNSEEYELEKKIKEKGLEAKFLPPGISRKAKKDTSIEVFRRVYDHELMFNYREVKEIYQGMNHVHTRFKGDIKKEIFTFFSWVKVVHVPDGIWKDKSSLKLLDKSKREERIKDFINEYHKADLDKIYDTSNPEEGVKRSETIRENFATKEKIDSLSEDELFETLFCCHAFSGQDWRLGGKDSMRKVFFEENELEDIKKTISYLSDNRHDNVAQRVYECIHEDSYKIGHLGPASIMEIIGWVDPDIPPINGRVVKSLRFLGFDVPESIKILNL